jgi:hypothetical protein
MVKGKIQRGLAAGKMGRSSGRENAEANTNTSGRTGRRTHLDMKILLFSGKLPVDWWAP